MMAVVGDCVDTIREPISEKMRRKVLARDRYTCRYCGASGQRRLLGIIPAGEVRLEIDHVYPVSKGGDNSLGNLVAACFQCNRAKGDSVGTWPKPVGYFGRERRRARQGLLLLAVAVAALGVVAVLAIQFSGAQAAGLMQPFRPESAAGWNERANMVGMAFTLAAISFIWGWMVAARTFLNAGPKRP